VKTSNLTGHMLFYVFPFVLLVCCYMIEDRQKRCLLFQTLHTRAKKRCSLGIRKKPWELCNKLWHCLPSWWTLGRKELPPRSISSGMWHQTRKICICVTERMHKCGEMGPVPIFVPFPDFSAYWNEASFLKVGGLWLLLISAPPSRPGSAGTHTDISVT
jgi:hypothetical protein